MRKTILLIDDYESDRILYKEYLGDERYHFDEASDGEEAATLLENSIPDLILLDWQMPKMNGLETLQHLQTQFDLNGIPVIMITGMSKADVMKEAFTHGVVDFIEKPVDPEGIALRVENAMGRSERYMSLKTQLNGLSEMRTELEMTKAQLVKFTHRQDQESHNRAEFFRFAKDLSKSFEAEAQNGQKMLRDMSFKLDSLSSVTQDPAVLDRVKELQQSVSSLHDNYIGWQSLKMFMQKFYPGFIPKLLMKYPEMQRNDLRHCCYMKMGLSVVEVSEVLQISEKSVEVLRDKVRQYFDLNMEDSLMSYIESV